jgi:hypothetical protein
MAPLISILIGVYETWYVNSYNVKLDVPDGSQLKQIIIYVYGVSDSFDVSWVE